MESIDSSHDAGLIFAAFRNFFERNLMRQRLKDRLACEFCRGEAKVNAGGEDRIQKYARVAGQNPSVSDELGASMRIITRRINFRSSRGAFHDVLQNGRTFHRFFDIGVERIASLK